jgi:hypothetical protein
VEGLARIIASGVLAVTLQATEFHREHTAPETAYSGFAAHYRSGIMERVAVNRGMEQQECMIASTYEPLGSWLRVESQVTGAVKDCQVFDYPHPRDRDRIIAKGIVIEFGYNNIKEMCSLDYYAQEPPRACPVTVWRIE